MCGFIFALDDFSIDINNECHKLKYRGPDQTSIYVDHRIKCGFNRLSIVDNNLLSNQPMVDAERSWLLVFNGEIYNYKELQLNLEKKYHYKFKTDSDTEVLLAGLGFEGESFVRRLNGIYAFVFIDLRSYNILAGRDLFGVKPLYFALVNQALYFCSESLVLSEILNSKVDSGLLSFYMSTGSVYEGGSIYSRINSVKSNSIIRYNQGQLSEEKVSDVIDGKEGGCTTVNKVTHAIFNAVNRQVPPVPFGLMFSGGIDSTYLLSLLNQSERFHGTYAVNVDDDEMSELYWQEIAYEKFGPIKKINTIRLTKENFSIDEYRKVAANYDMPFFHPNYVGADRMAAAAKADGLKVLMSGEGADEVFLGYRWFYDQSPLTSIFEYTPYQALSQLMGANTLDLDHIYGMNKIEFFQKYYLQRWLNRSDMTGMKNSIEVRVPFLDVELVTRLNNLSETYKKIGGAKWLLKHRLKNIFDDTFIDRRKRGFDFPLNSWITSEHFVFLMDNRDLFAFDEEKLKRLFGSSNFMDKRLIFSLFSFAIWSGR